MEHPSTKRNSGSANGASNGHSTKDRKDVLIILDINGILVRKNNKHDHGGGWKRETSHSKKDDSRFIETKGAIFEIREGVRDFISSCFENYSVAIWSSTTFTNANPIIEGLFTADQKANLVFKWFRDHTKFDPDYGTDPEIKDFDTIKSLVDVYQSAMFNRRWTNKNTIIVDDTMRKLRFNPENNCVVVLETNEIDYTEVFARMQKQIALL